ITDETPEVIDERLAWKICLYLNIKVKKHQTLYDMEKLIKLYTIDIDILQHKLYNSIKSKIDIINFLNIIDNINFNCIARDRTYTKSIPICEPNEDELTSPICIYLASKIYKF